MTLDKIRLALWHGLQSVTLATIDPQTEVCATLVTARFPVQKKDRSSANDNSKKTSAPVAPATLDSKKRTSALIVTIFLIGESAASRLPNDVGMKRLIYQHRKLAASVGLIFMMAICAAAQSDQLATRSRSVSTVERTETTAAARKVYVRSTSLLVGGSVVEEKLVQNSEFKRLGFVITRERGDADFVLELRHDVLTKYVFTIMETKTSTVIAGGKLSSLGGTVAGKVAKRFVKEMSAAKQP